MIIKSGKMEGVYEVHLQSSKDVRGYFMRTYDEKVFLDNRVIINSVQENHSFTRKAGTIRGLHFQFPPFDEIKFIRVINGSILDVFLDLRMNSKTFGHWDSVKLTSDNRISLLLPKGIAHGFCTLTDDCDVIYKVDNFYKPDKEAGIAWDDPDLKITWPTASPIISERDSSLMSFSDFKKTYKGIVPSDDKL